MDTQLAPVGEQRFRELADNAPVLIWRSDPDMAFDWFNAVWLSFRGRTLEEELGYGLLDGIHPDDQDMCWKIYLDAFEARRSFSLEYRLRRYDGAYRWFLCNGRPFHHADGRFGGYLGSCTDITEQKEAIAQKDMMLRELHHRVRNNMQLISSLLTLRVGAARDAAVREELEGMQRRIFALAQVQQRLHDADQIQALDFGDHLRAMCAALAGSFSGGRCVIEVRAASYAIQADQAVLLTMIANELILSAFGRSASHADRIVNVEFAHDAGENRLAVEDRGADSLEIGKMSGGNPADARILQALVASLGGRMEVERAGRGVRVVVRYPERPAG